MRDHLGHPDPGRLRWWRRLPVLGGALFAYSCLLLAPFALLGLNSDAFELLYPIQTRGLAGALAWDGSYHWMPVTMLWLWLQHAALGLAEPAYQVVNVLQHGAIVVLVFWLGWRLTASRVTAFVAAFLFASAAGYYEVVYWSVAGSNYEVSTFLYLAGVLVFVGILKRGGLSRYWVFTACVALAVLAHELAVTLVPACAAYYLLVQVGDDGPRFWRAWRRWVVWARLGRLLAAPSAVIAAFALVKAIMSRSAEVLGPPQDAAFFGHFLLRGIAGALSLRGDDRIIGGIAWRAVHAPLPVLFAALLAVAGSVAFAVLLTRLERFALIWMLGQLLLTQLVIGVASRHLYLPTVAAALLLASVSCRWGSDLVERVRRRAGSRAAVAAGAALVLVVGTIFLVGPLRDRFTAGRLWRRSDLANQSLRAVLAAAATDTVDHPVLDIVGATKYVAADGFAAWTFQNGLARSVDMRFPGAFRRVRLWRLGAADNAANGSSPLDDARLTRMVRDGRHIVVCFAPDEDRFQPCSPDEADTAADFLAPIDARRRILYRPPRAAATSRSEGIGSSRIAGGVAARCGGRAALRAGPGGKG